MSKARQERTEQARKVLADTHIARPILSGIRSALATKRGTVQKRWKLHSEMPQEEQEAIGEYTADIEALERVSRLLEGMNRKAFDTIRYDVRRDVAADIASTYAEVVDSAE